MLNIWPVNQPVSRIADFACCAILDLRSPRGNDYVNQGVPSGMSTVVAKTTSDLSAIAGLLGLSSEPTGSIPSGTNDRGDYRNGQQDQKGSRLHAHWGMEWALVNGRDANLAKQGNGLGHTNQRPTRNR